MAVHYCRCTPEPLDDLIQVGLLGLIRAAELFKPAQGTPFEAFARPHIRGAILHHLRDSAPAVRLPRRQAELQEKLLRLERECQAAGQAGGLLAKLETLGIDSEQAGLLLRQRRLNRPLALMAEHEELISAPDSTGSVGSGDWPESGPADLPEGGARALLAGLGQRERLVVEQVVLAGLSYRELARRLEVSPMTVQRLLHRGLDELREQLEIARRPLTPPPPNPWRSAAAGC